MDISKPTTTRTKQDIKNFEEGWDRIFGKIKKKKNEGTKVQTRKL